MQWQPRAPVSRRFRYAILVLVLAVVAFVAVVVLFVLAFLGMATNATS